MIGDAACPVSHRIQMKPGRSRKPVGCTINEYRRIRDELRQTTDADREYLLRDALDSVWFRLRLSERRRLNREYAAYLKGKS